ETALIVIEGYLGSFLGGVWQIVEVGQSGEIRLIEARIPYGQQTFPPVPSFPSRLVGTDQKHAGARRINYPVFFDQIFIRIARKQRPERQRVESFIRHYAKSLFTIKRSFQRLNEQFV